MNSALLQDIGATCPIALVLFMVLKPLDIVLMDTNIWAIVALAEGEGGMP